MWPLPFNIALDLANQHVHELELEASRARLAAEAREGKDRARAVRTRTVRAVAARGFRALSDATHALSLAACTVATRIEGPVA